mmetsp:Transcript_28226/g.24943  ORF Transcript_28226/g.24943 Transcript_28226/m.24943 type:complete len:146 (+) Transcript_28226:1-438(+)
MSLDEIIMNKIKSLEYFSINIKAQQSDFEETCSNVGIHKQLENVLNLLDQKYSKYVYINVVDLKNDNTIDSPATNKECRNTVYKYLCNNPFIVDFHLTFEDEGCIALEQFFTDGNSDILVPESWEDQINQLSLLMATSKMSKKKF